MGTLGGSNFIFPRLYRHMFVVAVDSFEDSTIVRIFTTIGDWHFSKGYPEKVALLSRVRIFSSWPKQRNVERENAFEFKCDFYLTHIK